VNLDTVGRLGKNPITVLATGTAREWAPIIQGVGFETGLDVRSIAGNGESSDQESFIVKGIPGVQLFSGANLDYHRPTDTADKIDAAGMVKIAAVAREIVSYLAERPTPLTATIGASGAVSGAQGVSPTAGASPGEGGTRRVSFGMVPDYAFTGSGVRAESVEPGTPAAAAGVAAGDVLVEFGGTPIGNLSAFSDKLKTLAPGDKIKVVVMRGTERIEKAATLVER
jgi:C-terminal processing protease CtpA/Prc